MRYKIQQRVHSLIKIGCEEEGRWGRFSRDDIHLMSWNDDPLRAWKNHFWLAECLIESPNHEHAWRVFNEKLCTITSRIAFLGQGYLEFYGEPFLIKREDLPVALYRDVQDSGPVPLTFAGEEKKAFSDLMSNGAMQNEFFNYWNDAVNTFGYSAKLILMLVALEALFKKERELGKPAYYSKIQSVFGEELTKELFGTREDHESGLRQRLVHGEYLSMQDTKNYVEEIHKRIVRYFNDDIFRDKLIKEAVANPQRHPYGNRLVWMGFIKPREGSLIGLQNVFAAFEKDHMAPEGYDIASYEERPDPF